MTDIFDFDNKPSRYAVMGNPIKHSKSPLIHQQFAEETQQNITYEAIHVDLGGFTQAVRNFQANNGAGINITVPFKLEAFRLADKLSDRAKRAGAVNTLILNKDDSITGDNTDGFGLSQDICEQLAWQIKGKKLLILGAGGATRGIIEPLLLQQPSEIFIANRTPSKAKDLADDFSSLGQVKGGSYDDLNNQHYDLVINATSASLQGDVPPIPETIFSDDAMSYDLMYGAEETSFMLWSKQYGAKHVSDGLGMLVGQAAESFFLWRDLHPTVQPVIKSIRKQMTN